MKPSVTCPYCQQPAVFKPSSKEVYGGRNYGPIYHCAPCQAWVGCHRNTTVPLGRLADAQLREWKMRAHRHFDPLWKSGSMSRSAAYRWLADRMGIASKDCHIGLFDVGQCQTAVRLVTEYRAQQALIMEI